MSSPRSPYLLAAAAFVLFGSTSLVVKPSALSGLELVFARMVVTAAFILPLIFVRGQWPKRLTRGAVFWAFATSASVFLNMVCLFSAFKLAPIPVCVALFYTGPIMTVLIKAWLAREPLTAADKIAAGAVLAIIGTLVLVGASSLTLSHAKGYLLALCGGFFFSLIPIVEARSEKLAPPVALGIQALFAAVCLAPFVHYEHLAANAGEWRSIVLLGLVFTLAPFLLWWTALRKSRAISPFISYVDPATAVIVSTLVLGERISALETTSALALGACALAHVYFSSRPRRAAALLAEDIAS